MNIVFSNPTALWALLAIPVIVLIHFLQESSKQVRVSTLFLLERVAPESIGGARFERLRQSVPLWLQILAALLITWLLSGPRWLREDSRQTVVVVLDSSVSMSAFKENTRSLLQQQLHPWTRSAAHTDWHLIESDQRKPSLYSGQSLNDLLTSFDTWQPTSGAHDLEDSLMSARGLVKGTGQVIVVSDHSIKLASDLALLSAGEPIDNVGFSGSEVKLTATATDENQVPSSHLQWRVMVKNYGNQTQKREWWMEQVSTSGSSQAGARHEITIPAGETLVLSGELPPDIQQANFHLTPDQFIWDDHLPLQRPIPRQVHVAYHINGPQAEPLRKLIDALPDVIPASSLTPSLEVTELGISVNTHAIQVPTTDQASESGLDTSLTVAEDHPLTRGLNWMGLLTSRPKELVLLGNDEPLLWKGGRVLALLRHDKNTTNGQPLQRLILNWDLSTSNAPRHPAVLVLLHRFVSQVRDNLDVSWADNFECNQLLPLANSDLKIKAGSDMLAKPYLGRLPELAGFFQILKGEQLLISGSTQFADTREANFRAAEPMNTLGERRAESALRQSEADPWTPVWLLALLACLLLSWGWKNGQNKNTQIAKERKSPAAKSTNTSLPA